MLVALGSQGYLTQGPRLHATRQLIFIRPMTTYGNYTHIYNKKYTIIQAVRYTTYTELSKKMDGIWNPYNLKSTGRIYTFCVLKCSEKFKVLDLP